MGEIKFAEIIIALLQVRSFFMTATRKPSPSFGTAVGLKTGRANIGRFAGIG